MRIFLLILFILSVFLEGTVTALPLVIPVLIIVTFLLRNAMLFFLAFFAGLLLDAFALRPIGVTSIFLLIIVFLICLYQRKYQINSYPFIIIASFVGSLIYLFIFGYQNILWLTVLNTLVAGILFTIIRVVQKVT